MNGTVFYLFGFVLGFLFRFGLVFFKVIKEIV